MLNITYYRFHSIILGVLSLTAGIADISAAPITPDEAAAEASSFLNVTPAQGNLMRAPASASSLSLAYTAESNGKPLYYIFNHADGFVIVSADTRFNTILGYSDSGRFDESRIPDNMKTWLAGYAGEISHYMGVLPENPQIAGQLRASAVRTPIEPLVKTKWNQDNPYNLLCPVDNRGGRAVTGCVATAYAQIMKYHEWPRNPAGSSGGVDFSGTLYTWRNMLDEYIPGEYSATQSNAVATLMRQCGAAVDMQYSSWMSGAYSFDVQTALTRYFKYAPDLKMLWKDYIPQKEWASIIYAELAAGRPVYYSGSSPQGGHAFVCDGYSENEYFHFNWGWGGYEDGYYLLSALNPAAGGAGSFEGGYTSNQSVIINIHPGTDTSEPTQSALISNGGFYHVSGNNYAIMDSGKEVDLVYNPLGYTQKVQIGLEITSVNNDMTPVYDICGTPLELESMYGFLSVTGAPLPSLPDGEYKVSLVYRCPDAGDEWQPVLIPIGKQNYVSVKIAGGKATFSNPGPDRDTLPQLIFGSPQFTPEVYGNLPIAVRLPVVNVGKGDFFGNLGVTLSNDNDEFANFGSSYDYYSIPAETSRNIDITFFDKLTPGTYSLSILDMNGIEYADGVKINVKDTSVSAPEGDIVISEMTPSFVTSGRPSPINITVKNSSFTTLDVEVEFEVMDSDFSIVKSLPESLSASIPGSASQREVVSPFDFGLQPGQYYLRAIDSNGKPLSEPSPLIVTSAVLQHNGISYIVTSEADRHAMIVAPEGDAYTGNIEIPASIDGYSITGIRNDAFTFADVRRVSLPASISDLQPGTFYSDNNLSQISFNTESVIPYKAEIFNPDNEANIWLNMPQEVINQWMSLEGWNKFRSPAWYITAEDGVEITDGLSINPATGLPYAPYRMNFNTPLSLSLKTLNGQNVFVIVVLNGEWIRYEVIDPSTTVLKLPAPGFFSTGRVSLAPTDEAVYVDAPAALPEDVTIYSIDGRLIAKDVAPETVNSLQKGLYIVNGRKILVK